MMWFSALLLFETDVDDGHDDECLEEESVYVFQADDPDTAMQRAEAIGRNGEIAYRNDEGASVTWRFVRVIDVQDLCSPNIEDGMEVYSTIRWKPSANR